MPGELAARATVGAVAALALGVAACGGGGPPVDDAFRVALLTPGSIRDAGWNQSAYEGLERIRDELGAEIAHQETRTPQEFEAGFRDFAARDFDLVFGHGFEFQDAAALVGDEYPDTVFVTTSGSTVRSNVAPIVFELEQATYVLGYVAALLSEDAQVGAVGGVEIPSVESTFFAFEQGARRAHRSPRVAISYTGSWTDVASAREATLAQIATGVDVLIHNANEGARGFFQAVRESEGVYAFGANRDQSHLAPDRVVASATLDVAQALLLVAREVRDGEFTARSIRFGLVDGVVAIAWNEPVARQLPVGLRAKAEALARRIKSGRIQAPRRDF